MAEKKELECCVVRDLLPTYVEGLTEPETSRMVAEHLAGCPACRDEEGAMRAHVPAETAPRRALGFLRRVRRTRLLAAALTAVLTLWCVGWLYNQEFHYPNTEAGRLSAVEDYATAPEDSNLPHGIRAGTPLRVVAYAERGDRLYVAYAADNADNVHGILELIRGWNGRYQILRSSEAPFPYTAGVMTASVGTEEEGKLYALVGDGCREIYGIRVAYEVGLEYSERPRIYEKTYAVTEPDFFWLTEPDVLGEELGLPEEENWWIQYAEVTLLDQNGADVTEQYRDDTVEENWGSGKSTAERFMLYVLMGGAALLGGVLVRYFLRRD